MVADSASSFYDTKINKNAYSISLQLTAATRHQKDIHWHAVQQPITLFSLFVDGTGTAIARHPGLPPTSRLGRSIGEIYPHHSNTRRRGSTWPARYPLFVASFRVSISVEEEIGFIRLLEQLTNGSVIDINHTGTSLFFQPGAIIGGRIQFDCPTARPIGYYLEFLLPVCLFAKNNTELVLTGVTNGEGGISVDLIRTVMLPTLQRFGVTEGLELKVVDSQSLYQQSDSC